MRREYIAAEMEHETTSTKRGRRSVETKPLDESSKRENQLAAKRKQKGGGGSQAEPTSLDGALSKWGDGWNMEPKVTRRRLFFFFFSERQSTILSIKDTMDNESLAGTHKFPAAHEKGKEQTIHRGWQRGDSETSH